MFMASFLIFAVILLGISYQLEKHMRVTHIEVVKDELRSITAITAFHVNGDIVEQLQYPEQEESDEYDSIKKTLLRVMNENKKIHDIYVMRKSENKEELVFVVDVAEMEEHAALGELYDIALAPDMLQGFIQPSVDADFTNDKWGQTLSGYAPIRNSKGEVVAILGIDFDANGIKTEFEHRTTHILFDAALGMCFMLLISLLMTQKLVGRLNNIKYAIDMLLEEKLNVSVHDTGEDEIKVLASRVNKLIKKLVMDKEQMFMGSITGLINALEAKDLYTYGHSSEVSDIANDIMKELQIDPDEQFVISFAAVLHDIGKIGIPDHIIHKTTELSDEEFAIIRQHPVIGEKILEGIPSLDKIRYIVRHHHERYDGTGYPDRLVGESILLGARVITVADSFQAMISDRPYRKGMSQEVAVEELEKNKGTQFDPHIVNAFLSICRRKQYKKEAKVDKRD